MNDLDAGIEVKIVVNDQGCKLRRPQSMDPAIDVFTLVQSMASQHIPQRGEVLSVACGNWDTHDLPFADIVVARNLSIATSGRHSAGQGGEFVGLSCWNPFA